MKNARASKSRGFTLIELMVTIGVLTILIVLALPSFFGAIDRRRVVDATEAVGKQIQQARTSAIETNRPIRMVFDAASDPWCFGLTDAATCDCTTADSCTIPFGVDATTLAPTDYEEVVGRAGQFPGVDLVSAPATLRFEPRRGVRDDGGNPVETVVVRSARGLEAHVMVNIIGRVSTCSPAGASNVSVMKTCP